jgi:hypothetical protein
VPEPGTLALFALAAITLIAIPGPNALYIAARSLSQGRAAGIASALGVEAGTLVHVAAAAAGLSALSVVGAGRVSPSPPARSASASAGVPTPPGAASGSPA